MYYIHYTNSLVFHPISKVIQYELGGNCEITNDLSKKNGIWILFYDSFYNSVHKQINSDYIAVQSEPLHIKGNDEYYDFLNNAIDVWDYTDNFKIGYSKIWESEYQQSKPIDVLFYGSLNDRRLSILNKIKNVKIIGGEISDYSNHLWLDYIMKSKIILSVPFYEPQNTDFFRIAPLLSNRCFVISEKCNDEEFNNNPNLLVCDKDEIPELCEYYVNNPLERLKWINKGYEYIKNNPISIPKNKTTNHKTNVDYKIKLVHLQTTQNEDREKLSRKSLQQVIPYGIEYVLHQNELYTSLPPVHTSIRPHNVRMSKYENVNDPEYGNALTPAHYGCFEAFKIGILSEFDNDLDFLIVCEGDCIIEVPIEEFIDKVNQVCSIVNQENISYFSFGDTKTLDFGWHQSNVVREVPNQDLLFITDKIIGLQCIMFPKKVRKTIMSQLRTHRWDCADTFFNIICGEQRLTMGILKERITTQADGISFIDKENKIFIK
jgi:hypothetical protein